MIDYTDAALSLAEGGWSVFPCQSHGDRAKAPLTNRGFKDASTDPEQIRSWWSRWPDALIGAALPMHLIVLDLDPRHGGTMANLETVLGPLPPTLTVWSGRNDNGCHLYYYRPPGELTQTILPEGVDLRIGSRHYLIMPPSRHPATGLPYRWQEHPVSHLTPLAASKLRRTTRVASHRPANPDAVRNGLLAFVAGAPAGERNRRLFWAACRASESGDADLYPYLKTAALNAGLTAQEIDRTIRSATTESRTA